MSCLQKFIHKINCVAVWTFEIVAKAKSSPVLLRINNEIK
jgi:hypothetical protein